MINKKTINRHTLIIVASVFLLTIITLGTSYGIFFSIKTNSVNQTITSGTLSVEYGSSSTSINSNDMMPMSDEDGLAQTNNSLIYVQNNGTLDSTYTLTVSYDYASFIARSDYESSDAIVPMEYLRMAIYEYNTETSKMTQIGDVLNLGDLPVYSVDTTSKYNDKYTILFSTLGNPNSGNSSKTYAVKVWLDEDATECISGYYVYLKIDVNSGVTQSKLDYSISGVLKDSNSAAVAGATVSLQNGSKVATTSSSGYFSLSGVQEGTYLVSIKTSSSIVYSGTLRIVEGTAQAINAVASSHQATTGNTLSSLAYTYATTPLRVKKNNSSLTLDTLATNLTVGQTYTIPVSYVLTGSSNSNIGTLNINLGTSNNISSFSLS